MNYVDIYKADTTNGPGIRTVLWVSGCSHHCKECHNPQTWNKDVGTLYTKETEEEILESLQKPWIDGITFSGGDPLYSDNLKEVLNLIKAIEMKTPEKTIWLYTGYTWEEIFSNDSDEMLLRQEIIKHCDVIVDGEFILDLKNLMLKYRGSSNQRVINVNKSLEQKNIVLYYKESGIKK